MKERMSFFKLNRRHFLSKTLTASSLLYFGSLNSPAYTQTENKESPRMDYHKILDLLAPCGLSCHKCFVYTKGVIPYHSMKLQELLGNFHKYAEGASTYWAELKNFTQFEEVLNLFASPDCKGCRHGDCKHPNCGVIDCYKKKGVDFCFQCGDFPCDKTNFDPNMSKMWLQMNTCMKEIGVEAYYKETKDELRYP